MTRIIISGALGRKPGEDVGEYDYEVGTLTAGDNFELVPVGRFLRLPKIGAVLWPNMNWLWLEWSELL